MEGKAVDMEDIHGIALSSVFKTMKTNPNKLLVNTEDNLELTLNRNVLALFSPFLRSTLGSIPCCTSPTMFLPDINTRTIIKLRDILNTGVGDNCVDLKESGDVFEAASVLGIDLTSLYYGAEKIDKGSGEVTVDVDRIGNKSKQMKQIFDLKNMPGKEVLFVSEKDRISSSSKASNHAVDGKAAKHSTTIENVAGREIINNDDLNLNFKFRDLEKKADLKGTACASPTKKGSGLDATKQLTNIKKETPVIEDRNVNDSLETKNINLSDGRPRNNFLEHRTQKNQCEKCPKGFTSLTLLRYHYCAHYRTVLKKRYASLYDTDKCLVCMKTFPNPGRLLLHIGINHDKINEILKSKGISELPPYSPSTTLDEGMEPLTENDSAFYNEDADKEDTEMAANSNLTKDEKNVPLLGVSQAPPVSRTISTHSSVEEQSTHSKNSSSFPDISTTSKSPVPFTPTAAPETSTSSFDKNDANTTSECNYDLECKVCDQKVKNISLLEQHCCRHFMRELQDQYSSLMDGLKCNICHSIFKQKHSLILHIGCKHGKINEILKKKGYGALPCPVSNSSMVMQKQLTQVKQERLEMDAMTDNNLKFRKEIGGDDSRAEAPDRYDDVVSHSETTTSPMPTLDDILRKYQV